MTSIEIVRQHSNMKTILISWKHQSSSPNKCIQKWKRICLVYRNNLPISLWIENKNRLQTDIVQDEDIEIFVLKCDRDGNIPKWN